MDKPTTLRERIKAAYEKEGMRDFAEAADAAEVARNSMYRWLEKGEIGRESSANALASALRVNKRWLMTGEGPMSQIGSAHGLGSAIRV